MSSWGGCVLSYPVSGVVVGWLCIKLPCFRCRRGDPVYQVTLFQVSSCGGCVSSYPVSGVVVGTLCIKLPCFRCRRVVAVYQVTLFQVSSWGGYVFLINLIPLHVLVLMATGRFSHRVYVAYSTVSAAVQYGRLMANCRLYIVAVNQHRVI